MIIVPSRFTDASYFLLRVVAGIMFAMHGAQKLFGVLGGKVVTGDTLDAALRHRGPVRVPA